MTFLPIVWDDVLVKREVLVYQVCAASKCRSMYAYMMSKVLWAGISISDYKDHKERKG